MVAGLTNVVTMSAGAGPDRIDFCMASELGRKGGDGYIGAHAIGQEITSNSPESPVRIAMRISAAGAEQPAKFIRRLEAVPEDGTMMDNTLIGIVRFAEGHHPVCHEWPFILIGDLGGRPNWATVICVIRTAIRVVRLPTYPSRLAVGEQRHFGVADFGLVDLDQSTVGGVGVTCGARFIFAALFTWCGLSMPITVGLVIANHNYAAAEPLPRRRI